MTQLHRRLTLGAAVAAVMLAGAAAPALAQSAAHPTPADPALHAWMTAPTFSLSAHGEVRVAPDMATISTGVRTEAATAEQAMADNRAAMNQVVAALRRQGVEARHIQTSNLNLSPIYDYTDNIQRLRGYQASNQVTVRVEDLSRLGHAVDAVVSAGANQIQGISFGLRDPSAAEDEARRAAVRALQARAELYAQATGLRLVGLRSLSEGGGYSAPPPMPMYRMEAVRAADASTPVEAGELTVRIDVQGVYELAR